MISYKNRGIVRYGMRQQDNKARDNRKQIFMSKSLRAKMMEVAYDLLFGGHLGARKPKTGFKLISFGQYCSRTIPVFADRRTFATELYPEVMRHGLFY